MQRLTQAGFLVISEWIHRRTKNIRPIDSQGLCQYQELQSSWGKNDNYVRWINTDSSTEYWKLRLRLCIKRLTVLSTRSTDWMYQRREDRQKYRKRTGKDKETQNQEIVWWLRQLTVFWNVTPCSQVATYRRLLHDRKKGSNFQDQ